MLSCMSTVAIEVSRIQTGVMDNFGDFLASRREAAGYRSQTAFANAIGKGASWVSRLERGAAKELPPPEDVALLAKSLNLSSAELIAAAGYDIETGNEGDTPAIATVRAILGNKQYSEKQLIKLDQFFRSMLEIIDDMEG